MRFVEETGGSWTAEQLRAAEAEIEQQKREWEANRLAALQKQEEDEKRAAEEDDLLTYSREDAQNQVNNNKFSKRKPVNRRLLKVKQNDRNSVANKRLKNRVAMKKPVRTIQTSLGPHRALRNNSKPIISLAKNEPLTSDANKSGGEQSTKSSRTNSKKRSVAARNMNRLAKQSKSIQAEATVSSDDEPLIKTRRNNGIDELKSMPDDEKIDEPTESSDCQQSEDFDDSECSLDVMVDSTDPQDSDEDRSNNDDDDDDSIELQSDASAIETDTDATKENNRSLNSTLKSGSIGKFIDTNSPRTRSRGRVKINLWTLDESQNLPELCAKRGLNKSGGSKNASNIENGNGSSAEDIANNESDSEDEDCDRVDDNDSKRTDDSSDVLSKSMRQSKISECFNNTSSKLSNSSSPGNVTNRKSLPAKSGSKSIPVKKSTNTTMNLSTIESHLNIRSPKVVLNKQECELQKSRLKSKI